MVKNLRRFAIADDGPANAFLEGTHLPEHNACFARSAASAEDIHRRVALDGAFKLEETG